MQAIIAFNFGPQPKYPKLLIGRPDEVPLKEVVEGVAKLVPLGLRVEASELRDRLGLSEPGPGAEVLGRPAPASAPPPGPPALNAQQLPTPEVLDALTDRLRGGMGRALGAMTARVRAEVEAASDLQDLAQRLALLRLDPAELALAMGQGLSLAHLVGQAALLDELGDQGS